MTDIEEIIITPNLEEKLKNLPTKPGVYIYKNEKDVIIYIGKAKNLRNRVRSYFQENRPIDAKTKAMITKIRDLELFVVDTEAEALILEDTLIKKHKPRYNILLRDDKSYPYIAVTNEQYPKIFSTRKIYRNGTKYYGPFTDGRMMKSLLRTIRNVFLVRSCDLKLSEEAVSQRKFKICLDYHIKKCEGPCENFITKEKYSNNIQKAIQILNGKTKQVENLLNEEMERLSEEFRYEEAATLRNRIMALRDYEAHQKIVSTELIDRDVLGYAKIEENACTLIFKIREGKLVGKRHFIIPNIKEKSDAQIIQASVEKWYLENDFIPRELLLASEPEDIEFLESYLKSRRGAAIEVAVPKIGEKRKLADLASANAEFQLREYIISLMKRDQTVSRPVLSLQRDLRLSKPPRHIECIDNSHLQGTDLVSSVVVFIDGKPAKSEYRKYKLKTVDKNDDFASMREVVERRYKRLIEEKKQLPDLIIIDGGKGQLSAACSILKELNILDKLIIIGLAKRLDEIIIPEVKDSVLLPRTSSSLRLIQKLRDEAHRFAITYHRNLRDKRTLQSEISNISGIGDKKTKKLLSELGSVENIKKASFEKIKDLVGTKAAEAVINYFKLNL